MKAKSFFLVSMFFITFCSYTQEVKYDKFGKVKSVAFEKLKGDLAPPSTSEDFIYKYLTKNNNHKFRKVKTKKVRNTTKRNEQFSQFYKGVKVYNSGYVFHYDENKLISAHGSFIDIKRLDVKPDLTSNEAFNVFLNYKNLLIEDVKSFKSELYIKEFNNTNIDTIYKIRLVYRVSIKSDSKKIDEIGYIDAHSGEVVQTTPIYFGMTETARFETRYNGTQNAETSLENGDYILLDDSRAAEIHTMDLAHNLSIADADDLTDNDNNWRSIEYSINNLDMGLDVHWALQKIYDYFYLNYGYNSFDDQGFNIDAYIRFDERDNARWQSEDNYLLFGDGEELLGPVASVDAVAHEYGHGISDMCAGIEYSNFTNAAIQEGMSDIWAVILENEIRPNDIWKIGEQVYLNGNCIRNIADPDDPDAHTQMVDTHGTSDYSSGDQYVRSGVFSYWFYLLVNGGSGTNDLGNNYSVAGIGMDAAKDLMANCIYQNYLNFSNTFEDIRDGFENYAIDEYGSNSLILNQIEQAWYAVGVGNKPSDIQINGSYYVCNWNSSFSFQNLPPNASITWNKSNNLTYISGQGTNTYTVKTLNSGTSSSGYISATVTADGITTQFWKNIWAGKPNVTISGPDEMYCYSIASFSSNHIGDWSFSSPLNWSSYAHSFYSGNNTNIWEVETKGQEGQITISQEVSNVCGTTQKLWGITIYEPGSGGGPGGIIPLPRLIGNSLSITPNPATDFIEVTINWVDDMDSDNQVIIIDQMGNVFYNQSHNLNELSININNLPSGVNTLMVINGNESQSKQFIKE